jgi:hypothetical protein
MSHPEWYNGHAFQEGSALGRLSAQGDRQIYLLELLHDQGVALHEQGEALPERIAEKINKTESSNGISIKLRDIPGIVLGLMAILAALNGKLSLTDAFALLGKVGGSH